MANKRADNEVEIAAFARKFSQAAAALRFGVSQPTVIRILARIPESAETDDEEPVEIEDDEPSASGQGARWQAVRDAIILEGLEQLRTLVKKCTSSADIPRLMTAIDKLIATRAIEAAIGEQAEAIKEYEP